MANDPLNSPGFSIPSLQTYQQALRDRAVANASQSQDGWRYGGLMAGGVFDLTRALGLMTPEERKVASANQVQQDAVRQTTASDPAEARLQQLSYMAQKFNQLGLSDLAAQVMPELNALTQRKIELRKLTGEASKAQTDAEVATATEGANIVAPFLKNTQAEAQTREANTSADYTAGAKTAESKAKAALDYASAAEKGGEYQNYVNPKTSAMTTVLKSNAAARAALASAGFIEDNVNLNPTKVGDLQLPRNTQQDLYKSVIGAQTQLDNIAASMQTFKPEYLTTPGRVAAGIQGAADKAGLGGMMNAQQHANLAGYQAFYSNSIKSLNQYIHDLTGAQMSAAEADRLRSSISDPQNQGPTQFAAALKETVRGLLQVQARAKAWLDANGDAGGTPPTGDEWNAITMPRIPEAQIDAYMRKLGVPTSSSAQGTTPPPAEAGPTTAPSGFHQIGNGVYLNPTPKG